MPLKETRARETREKLERDQRGTKERLERLERDKRDNIRRQKMEDWFIACKDSQERQRTYGERAKGSQRELEEPTQTLESFNFKKINYATIMNSFSHC